MYIYTCVRLPVALLPAPCGGSGRCSVGIWESQAQLFDKDLTKISLDLFQQALDISTTTSEESMILCLQKPEFVFSLPRWLTCSSANDSKPI